VLRVGEAAGLARTPEPVLLLDESLDAVENGLVVH
jgi:hypothetical protein